MRFGPAGLVTTLGLVACAAARPTEPPATFRVTANPYAAVDWSQTLRLKVELHDHVGTDTAGLRAYDRAGYDAMSRMHYSGAPLLSYAWTARRWPPEQWLGAGFRGSLVRIREFVPNAEEVGAAHVISPFLTAFISRAGNPVLDLPEDATYVTTQGCIDAIRRYGGLAFLAHPWMSIEEILSLRNYTGIEIYSAFARYHDEVSDSAAIPGGRGRLLLANWDAVLGQNPSVYGIAVNDHYGPSAKVPDLPATIRDSGKILVFAPDTTSAALREALRSGRFVAVADLGAVKDRYPELASISVTDTTITLATTAQVRWVVAGRTFGTTRTFRLIGLPGSTRYVRAELTNAEGSTVFTQAFGLEPR
jgi:hypothetical protein